MESSLVRKRMPASALFDPKIVMPAIGASFRKLDPRTLAKNPVMFVLEMVTLLAGDPDLLALGLAAHALRSLGLDQLVDLTGLVRPDADLDRHHLPHGVLGRLLHGAVLDAPQRDAPLDQLLFEHLAERLCERVG